MKIGLTTLRDIGCIIFLLIFFDSCSSPKKQKTYSVEIKQMKFTPAELVLQKGDTVAFINHDLLTHDVTEQKNKSWTSTPLPPDSSWRLVVTESSDYYCTIHPVMKGKLVVE